MCGLLMALDKEVAERKVLKAYAQERRSSVGLGKLLDSKQPGYAKVGKCSYCISCPLSAVLYQGWQHALWLLVDLEGWLQPTVVTYSTALDACAKASEWQQALGLLQRMGRRGLELSPVVQTTGISALGRGGKWEMALQLLGELQVRRLEAQVLAYNAAISACDRGNQWRRAVFLLGEICEAPGSMLGILCAFWGKDPFFFLG